MLVVKGLLPDLHEGVPEQRWIEGLPRLACEPHHAQQVLLPEGAVHLVELTDVTEHSLRLNLKANRHRPVRARGRDPRLTNLTRIEQQ